MKKEVYYVGLFIILIFILCWQQCNVSRLKTDLAMKDNNLKALTDTITETKNKLGQAQYEKSVLISSKKGLEDLNADLAKEVKAQAGKIAYLSKIVSGISTDHGGPIDITPIQDPISQDYFGDPCDTSTLASYRLPWNSDKQFDSINYRKLSGEAAFTMKNGKIVNATHQVLKDEINFDLVTGLEKKGDHYEIFVRSNYPGFKPSKIDGAFIPQSDLFPPQKKKQWTVGPAFNAGIGLAGTTLQNLSPVFYIGVGIGITKKWFQF
jgi:hypothetical protein